MMAVSKRTRFEVLRRDDHKCRYCGASAPDVKITVDHVLPVALGGDDSPTNLVACCSACNAGKTSTSPGEHLVADVDNHALRYAAARQRAIEMRRSAAISQRERTQPFYDNWEAWLNGEGVRYLPNDWRDSVALWLDDGLTMEELCDAADIAWSRTHVKVESLFRYTAGIVQNKLADLEKAVRAELESEDDGPEGLDEWPSLDYWLATWVDSDPRPRPGIMDIPWKGSPTLVMSP